MIKLFVFALTSKNWHQDSIPVKSDNWIRGGTPVESSVMPWSISVIDTEDMKYLVGSLDENLIERVVSCFTTYLGL